MINQIWKNFKFYILRKVYNGFAMSCSVRGDCKYELIYYPDLNKVFYKISDRYGYKGKVDVEKDFEYKTAAYYLNGVLEDPEYKESLLSLNQYGSYQRILIEYKKYRDDKSNI